MYDVLTVCETGFLSLLVRLPPSVGRFSQARLRGIPNSRMYGPFIRVCVTLENVARLRGCIKYNHHQGWPYILAHTPSGNSA